MDGCNGTIGEPGDPGYGIGAPGLPGPLVSITLNSLFATLCSLIVTFRGGSIKIIFFSAKRGLLGQRVKKENLFSFQGTASR